MMGPQQNQNDIYVLSSTFSIRGNGGRNHAPYVTGLRFLSQEIDPDNKERNPWFNIVFFFLALTFINRENEAERGLAITASTSHAKLEVVSQRCERLYEAAGVGLFVVYYELR
ncbi:hypothetical protein BHM03_00052286 [Ensete ventricosum]|uniref:Uncharacterized protein n=1 Tax=Ensete ventricosum TaxID=4639 RepID=A0A426YQE3_ENSVE|nr:hypothetical protein B296_00049498 [Ensete ventricosum]RZS19844.1 hypothetical protein BHM03_00052286 [Ensete ventricosum]